MNHCNNTITLRNVYLKYNQLYFFKQKCLLYLKVKERNKIQLCRGISHVNLSLYLSEIYVNDVNWYYDASLGFVVIIFAILIRYLYNILYCWDLFTSLTKIQRASIYLVLTVARICLCYQSIIDLNNTPCYNVVNGYDYQSVINLYHLKLIFCHN